MDIHENIVNGSVVLKDRLIENEHLKLDNKKIHYFLSSGLTVRNCTLVLKVSARALFFREVHFVGCTFEVKQELKNHQDWVFASLEGCRFKGRFTGCDFGHWPEYPRAQHGFIKDCDFSEARLDGCRFMGCDERTLRFPKWPCFTFLDPVGHAAVLEAAPWPKAFAEVIIDDLRNLPPRTRALTLSAPDEARRYDTTPEALRAVIERFDCIVY